MMNDGTRFETSEISVARTILDTTAEIPMERDIVLPDYYPDVFRVLRCTAEPTVTSQSISGGRLTFEIGMSLKVLYLTDGSRRINCIEQQLSLSKTLEAGECISPEVHISAECQGISCRARGSRRLDVRGMVSAGIRIVSMQPHTIITGGSGCGIQLRRQTLTYPVKRLCASKRITVIQQTELPEGKPAINTVLRCGCTLTRTEHRIVAGKLAVKGEAELTVLYACIDSRGEDVVSELRFDMPFSQIIDMDGIDDSFEVDTEVIPSGCTVTAGSGEEKTAEWELSLNVTCIAERSGTGVAVTDVFSTDYPCEADGTAEIYCGRRIRQELSAAAECTLKAPDGTVGEVCGCYAACTRPTLRCENGKTLISGSAEFSVLGTGGEGGIFHAEGQSPYEAEITLPEGTSDASVTAQVSGCSYVLDDGGAVRAKAEISLTLRYRDGSKVTVITGVKLDKSAPLCRDGRCALRLCRCGENEDIWDIAKRCRTSPEAILEDNELTEEHMSASRMLVIRN